jgi:hypothetical protein
MTTICENYKLTTNDACCMIKFHGGNFSNSLSEGKQNRKTPKLVHGQQEPIHSVYCRSRVFLCGKHVFHPCQQ